MTYRLDELEVPAGDPFRNHSLERRHLVEFLSDLTIMVMGTPDDEIRCRSGLGRESRRWRDGIVRGQGRSYADERHGGHLYFTLIKRLNGPFVMALDSPWGSGKASADTVMKFLISLPGGKKFQTGRPSIVIHAYLLAADSDHDRAKNLDNQLRNDVENVKLSEDTRRRAADILEMKRHINGGMRMGVSLAPVAAKIDLAAMVRE